MLSCHSVYLYADQLIVLAEERAAELNRCEARELLDRPYKGMNLCGDTLNEQLDEQWPSSKKERPYYDAFCKIDFDSIDSPPVAVRKCLQEYFSAIRVVRASVSAITYLV